MDNGQYFYGWDLNGNTKTAFWDLGSYATQGSYLQSTPFLRKGKLTFSVQFFPMLNM